jgi:hypothetical protein
MAISLRHSSKFLFTVAALYSAMTIVIVSLSLVRRELVLGKSPEQATTGLLLAFGEIVSLVWYARLLHKKANDGKVSLTSLWTSWTFLIMAVMATIVGIYLVTSNIPFIDVALLMAAITIGLLHNHRN